MGKGRYTRTATEAITRFAKALNVLPPKEQKGRWKTELMLERLREHGYTVHIEGDDLVVLNAEGDIIPDPNTEFELDAYVVDEPVSLADFREQHKALKVSVSLGTSAERLTAVEKLYDEVAEKLPPSSARYKLQADLVKLSASMPERGDGEDDGVSVVPVEVDSPEVAERFLESDTVQ